MPPNANQTNTSISYEQVVNAIITGKMDDGLDQLFEAIRFRRSARNIVKAMSFNVGQKVRFVKGRPKYLIGLTAIITKLNNKTVSICFEDKKAAGKFGLGPIRCPFSLIETVATEDPK